MNAQSAARAFVGAEQRKFPPSKQNAPRLAALCDLLRPSIPPELQALMTQDDLIVYEVGEATAAVRSRYPRGGYAVDMTTGMFAYTDLAARYCGASFILGAEGSTPITLDEIALSLAGVMRTFLGQTRTVWKMFEPAFNGADVPVSDGVAHLRDQILDAARLFMLAHEMGHVAIATGVRPGKDDPNEEVLADRLGLEFCLPAAAGAYNWRSAIAGVGFAIRLFVSLERFGIKFSHAYPAQDERLALLEDQLRRSLGTEQRADELSTVMVAILDLMDDLDARLGIVPAAATYTESRVRVGVLARLIEIAAGTYAVETFAPLTEPYVSGVPPERLGAILNAVFGYYWDWVDRQRFFIAPSFLAEQTMFTHAQLTVLSQTVRAVANAMPEHLRVLLYERYRSAPA